MHLPGRGLVAALAVLCVALTLFAALRLTGSPAHQRALSLDERRVGDLDALARSYPATRDRYGSPDDRSTDPATGRPYVTHDLGHGRRSWCAVFDVDTVRMAAADLASVPAERSARHPAGPACLVYTKTASDEGRAYERSR